MDRPGTSRLAGIAVLSALTLIGGYATSGCWGEQAAVAALKTGAPASSRQPKLLTSRLDPPDVAFTGTDGEPLALRRFHGKVVVLSLWATWCAPCIREMPSLNQLAARLPGVAVVPVNVDAGGLTAATAFLEKHALENLAPYYDSTGKMLGLLNGRGLPTSLVIDRDGKIAAVVEGAVDWSSPSMLELLLGV